MDELSNEREAEVFKQYLMLRGIYSGFIKNLDRVVRNLDPNLFLEEPEIIIELAEAYSEALNYLSEMDELIMKTFSS